MSIKGNIIDGMGYRLSILTDRLIRFEYETNNHFTDEKTLNVINREFPLISYDCWKEDGWLIVKTDELTVKYDEKPFSAKGLIITLKNGRVFNFGDNYIDESRNLLGTARTLDNSDGPVEMGKGLFSKKGTALFDDSNTPLIIDGEVENRTVNATDVYLFAYGTDYEAGLKAFCMLTGKTPMIPRYALGNWWSKYEKYTEDSYNALLDDFKKENVPLSVGVIDMDWHVTAIDPKYGNGWTGFTWNKEYFPDYMRFLKNLHDRGLAVTLNIHPADGIRPCEEMYPEVAKAMGIDPASEENIKFDLADKEFRTAYYDKVLHPYEEAGVDFWWIDWQQGTKMGKSDADPLWLNNHYHFEDQEKAGKRAMIFSRYAGWGSHRYPIGFSGDTKTTWRSLDYQPWFTQTASNIGYGWWSHDIGGHMLGSRDDERLVRWIEFGVFSPIMRLHSSSSPFFVKEPWKQKEPYRQIIGDFMRLRHKMIPYLYTMNYLVWKEDMPLIRPMYYKHSDDSRSYNSPNEYYFGDSLIVGAVTKPLDKETQMAKVSMFLPEGTYYDLFTGKRYSGNVKRNMYRDLSKMPVLLPEDKIVAFNGDDDLNANNNPKTIELFAAFGKNAEGMLFEDDGISTAYKDGKGAISCFKTECDPEAGTIKLSINVSGDKEYIPEGRSYKVLVYGVDKADGCIIDKDKHTAEYIIENAGSKNIEITITGVVQAEYDYKKEVFDILVNAWTENVTKDIMNDILMHTTKEEFITALKEMDISENLRDALLEVF